MRTSTIVWSIVVLLIIGGVVWWIVGSAAPRTAPAPQTNAGVATSTAMTASSTPAIPGANLTLGQDKNAKVGSFLIGYNGMTLYTYAKDAAGVSNCTGQCAANWPPYVVTSTDNLVGESPLDSAKIGTLRRADGSTQVTYGGKPLYFYAGDSASGDTAGEGVGGVWHVAKP
ncbi:MAG: hypothetical protein KGI78_02230 [Patescibacteria group bacterium]|nr:hypothetical protein [Patescibacteria group bacterium]MDE1944517.1 hypothetical protein [Patescibacteria group bacterium]MDE1945372.1 hypothetical protein [Patescibacteria group bacterium]MDE2057651.1 hypothetical protein [Patescibacteria group bacterium]